MSFIKSTIYASLTPKLFNILTTQGISTSSALFIGKKKFKDRNKCIKIILHKDSITKYLEKETEEAIRKQDEIFDITDKEILMKMQEEADKNDMPVPGLKNPYEKPVPKCLLCEHKVELDYKNTRLLSQFISPYSGRVFDIHTTGLCHYMQNRVEKLITRARYFGLLPYTMKTPQYLKDPKLFDAFTGRPVRRKVVSRPTQREMG